MRNISSLLLAVGMVVLLAETSAATTITDTFEWGTVGVLNSGQTFSDGSVPTWDHDFTFSPPATVFNSALLQLRHVGNRGNTNEVWFLTTQANVFIGNLSDSSNSSNLAAAITDTFDVSSLLPPTPATSWTLLLKLGETQSGTNEITLDWSKLTVIYNEGQGETAVPEPTSLLLLGAGLVGVAHRRYRARRERH